jgi:protein-S-isoprenylcysteine O-methyltransferase Ste14
MKKRLKINGALIVCAAVLVLIFPKVFLQGRSTGLFSWIIRTCGVILILSGQLLRISARGYKQEHSGNGSLLIQGGPYAWVRNPMYLGIFLIGTGLGLAVFQYWVLGAFTLIFAARYMTLVFSEEKKLRDLFGAEYGEYCKRTPRLFPNPLYLLRHNLGDSLPLKTAWFYRELGSVLAVLAATLLLGSWGAFYR